MTIFKKMKYKIMAGLMAAGMVFAAGAAPAMAAVVEDDTSTATVQFTTGDLELIRVSSFNFGSREVSSANQDYPNATDSTMQVGDNRGSGGGWTLTAKLDNFTIGGTAALAGASITVNGATIAPINTANNSDEPEVNTDVNLVAGSAADTIAKAGIDEGLGGWTITWTAANTRLNVLADTARVGTATADIYWTLEDAA